MIQSEEPLDIRNGFAVNPSRIIEVKRKVFCKHRNDLMLRKFFKFYGFLQVMLNQFELLSLCWLRLFA